MAELGGGVAQVVDHLPRICKVLGSNPITTEKWLN
jgi:hypothetical protein